MAWLQPQGAFKVSLQVCFHLQGQNKVLQPYLWCPDALFTYHTSSPASVTAPKMHAPKARFCVYLSAFIPFCFH